MSRNFDDACFRIGAIISQDTDMNEDGHSEIENMMNNFVSIQITLQSSRIDNDIYCDGDDENNNNYQMLYRR